MSDNPHFPFADEESEKAVKFALDLFERSAKETQANVSWLLKNSQKRISELEHDCAVFLHYIDYVDRCIDLQVVPRSFDFWHTFIHYGNE